MIKLTAASRFSHAVLHRGPRRALALEGVHQLLLLLLLLQIQELLLVQKVERSRRLKRVQGGVGRGVLRGRARPSLRQRRRRRRGGRGRGGRRGTGHALGRGVSRHRRGGHDRSLNGRRRSDDHRGLSLQGDRHPWMVEDVLEGDSVGGSQPQAAANEILTLVGEARSKLDLGVADLLVLLEGDVAAHHVVEEDAETPDGGGAGVITRAANPLGRRVHSRTCNRVIKRRLR